MKVQFTPPLKKFSFKLILMAFALFLLVNSCKKDLYIQEIENKELQKNRIALLSQTQAELKKVNFSQFKTMVNQKSLGALKTELFLEENNLQEKTSSTKQTPAELSKYEVDKTSVNVLKAGGHTSYIFTIKQLSPRAITFRNLTIDESVNGTSAYITTYTPTKNWLKKRLVNSNIKFEGKTEILPLDLKDPNLLQLRNNTNLLTGNGKISALKPTNKVSTIQYSCTTVTIYDIVAYSCKAGTHMPWDSGCTFTGADAASYGLVAGVPQTSCIEIEIPNNSGGNTTPIGPPNYNPCDETSKNPEENENELPTGTIDDNPCDSSALDPQNPKDKYELIQYADSINLIKKLQCFNSIPKLGATYSISLHTDLPNEEDPNSLLNGTSPGHAFITMTKSNNGITISQTFGFYPQSAFKATFQLPVASQINNNEGHKFNAKFTMSNISEQDFNTLMTKAASLADNQYSMTNFNCTDYALGIFNSIRGSSPIVVPDWIISKPYPHPTYFNYGTTPNGLYKTINQMKTAGNNNAVIGTGYGYLSSKCN